MRPSLSFVALLSLVAMAFGCSPVPGQVAAGAGAVQAIPIPAPSAKALAARKLSYTFVARGNGAWTDTGVVVTPADHLVITATGRIGLGDGRISTPVGLPLGWKDLLRTFPLESANVGALVARIGSPETAVPFAVGSSLARDASATGELYLAANTGTQLAGAGMYAVHLTLSKAANTSAQGPSIQLEQVMSPALFQQMPRRVRDAQGDPGDMVNFSLLGTEAQVRNAFTAAGWVQVDKTTDDAVLHGLLATLSKKAYLAMPMSTLYLFNRPQDMSYARADPFMVALERHHLRLWNTGLTVAGQPWWVGSATHDMGLDRDARNNGVTHRIDPAIDKERDFIEQTFAAAGVLEAAAYVTPADPLHSAATATGERFSSDGRIVVMLLRGAR